MFGVFVLMNVFIIIILENFSLNFAVDADEDTEGSAHRPRVPTHFLSAHNNNVIIYYASPIFESRCAKMFNM